jgi:hypothetical protein
MTERNKEMLAALLIEYSQEEIKPVEMIATNDRDFKKLRKVYEIESAIDIILESFK